MSAAASTALPPFSRILVPTSAARGLETATTPWWKPFCSAWGGTPGVDGGRSAQLGAGNSMATNAMHPTTCASDENIGLVGSIICLLQPLKCVEDRASVNRFRRLENKAQSNASRGQGGAPQAELPSAPARSAGRDNSAQGLPSQQLGRPDLCSRPKRQVTPAV